MASDVEEVIEQSVVVDVVEATTKVEDVVDQGPPGPPGDTIEFPFSKQFLVAPYDSPFPFYVPYDCELTDVQAAVGTPPTGSPIILDILKNGTTVFPGGTGRPTISPGINTGSGTVPSNTTFSKDDGDFITIRIAQVGSTNPGAYLVLILSLKRSR